MLHLIVAYNLCEQCHDHNEELIALWSTQIGSRKRIPPKMKIIMEEIKVTLKKTSYDIAMIGIKPQLVEQGDKLEQQNKKVEKMSMLRIKNSQIGTSHQI